MMLRRIALLLVAAIPLLSCSRPDGYEQFIRSGVSGGVYHFQPDIPQTPSDIFFYTRVDKPVFSRGAGGPMCLEVSWCRNDSTFFRETVWYPLAESESLYRSGVQMASEGPWEVRVRIPDAPKGLRGLGIAVRKHT